MNKSEKQAFVIANKSLSTLATASPNQSIKSTATTVEMLDEMIDEIQNNPEFVDATQSEEIITDGVPPTVIIDGCGPCVELTAEKLGPGSVVFNYGSQKLYCNNAKIITAFVKGMIKAGDTVQFKAESITTNGNGKFIGDANVTATPVLQALQDKLNEYDAQNLALVNQIMLEEKCTRKRAQEIVAEQRADVRKATMVLPSLF